MDQVAPCPNCGSRTLYRAKDVDSGGSGGPDFLPRLGRFILAAKFTVVVCRDCGLTRLFAQPEARQKLKDSSKWTSI